MAKYHIGNLKMQKKVRSLLQELESLSKKDTSYIIESRGSNIITSAINLLELMNRHYGEEQAQLLEKRLLSAIKNRDQSRFTRSIRKKNEE